MKILLNGAWRELAAPPAGGAAAVSATAAPAATLQAVLGELGFAGATVATAVNGEFVPAAARALRPVRDGDRVEVLAPMQGG